MDVGGRVVHRPKVLFALVRRELLVGAAAAGKAPRYSVGGLKQREQKKEPAVNFHFNAPDYKRQIQGEERLN